MVINNRENGFYVEITNHIVKEFQKAVSPKRVLYMNISEFSVFSDIEGLAGTVCLWGKNKGERSTNVLVGDPLLTLDTINSKFDFIVGDLPLGMQKVAIDREDKKSVKIKKNWLMLYASLAKLNDEGLGVYIVEPAVWSLDWKIFAGKIQSEGFYVNAILNTPENVLKPYTSLRPNIVLISRKKTEKIFIAELTDVESVKTIVTNFTKDKTGNSIEEGIFVSEADFNGFDQHKFSQQITRLTTQYNEYEKHKLVDIALEINLGKTNVSFDERGNAVYIPRIGKSPVIADIKKTTLKHQNYFQVILNESIANSEYVAIFFMSELGRLMLDSLHTGTIIPNVGKRDLEKVFIPIPSLDEQSNIVEANKKLEKLDASIKKFRKELSLNPKSVNKMQERVEDILGLLDVLSESDQIRSMVRKGESKTVEFKQTLSLDTRKGSKEKYIEKMALKTIVAFLNTDGGVLLVGVDDNGAILGVQEEVAKFHKKADKYLLYVKDLIKMQVGEEFYPYIDYKLMDVDGTDVLQVKCKSSVTPCYLGGKEFYVRTNPASDQLDGPKLVEYINCHFKSIR